MSRARPLERFRRARALALAALLALIALLAVPAARAATSCSIAASGVNFGVYSPLAGTAATSTGTVTATCMLLGGTTTPVHMSVSLSTGLSGSYAARTLVSGAGKLQYNLYWGANNQQVWGDGTGGSSVRDMIVVLRPTAPLQQVSSTVYGQIPAGQDALPGTYLDTIVVTVNY